MLQTLFKLDRQKEARQICEIEINKIVPNPNQPRVEFTTEHISELAESIRAYGVIQPVTVRLVDDGRYELIAGERRLRACRMAGRVKIPAIVVQANDEASSVMALVENIMREDLNFFEEAEGIKKLIDTYGFTQEEAARRLCKTQSTIANKLRILRLSDPVKRFIRKYGLTERHARALLKLQSDGDREKVVKYIIKNNLNVKQSEELIDRLMTAVKKREGNRKYLFSDSKIFTNTINRALKLIQQAGVNATAKKHETEEFIEYTILIPKAAQAAAK